MPKTLAQIASHIGAQLRGDPSVSIDKVASLGAATGRDLVFVEDERLLAQALASRAAAVIAGEFAASANGAKPVLIARHARLAFARAARFLLGRFQLPGGVHPTAVVAPGVTLGAGVNIGPYAVVGAAAEIGDNTMIGPWVAISPGVRIGRDCLLHAHVAVYANTTIGDRVLVHCGAVLGSDGFGYVRDPETGKYEQFPQIGRLEIGDDVEIGANSTVDRGALDATVIGRGVKIDNLVHIGHNVTIGENVVIAAQTGISGSAVIENDAVIAGQVGIADHVRIEAGAVLGAQSGVPSGKVIRGPGVVFWGTPARPLQQYLKELAVLARLTKKK